MRTISVGWDAARREPSALVPLMLEAVTAAVLIVAGVFPADPASVTSAGAFPVGLYHDVKQQLAFATGWPALLAVVGAGVIVRGAVTAATLWLADEDRGSFLAVWARSILLGLAAVFVLLIPATLHFVGTAIRYAPFVLLGAAIGIVVAARFARLAVNLNTGSGRLRSKHAPGLGAYLTYGLFFSFLAVLAALAGDAPWPIAVLIAAMGPVHAVVLLGWRELATAGEDAGGRVGLVVIAVTVAALILPGIYDRYASDPQPAGSRIEPGSLMLLGGADSTSSTGALARFDPRAVGFDRDRTRLLSYRGAGEPYEAEDTRRDLAATARAVATQIEATDPPVYVLGHSQSALVLDRVLLEPSPPPIEMEASISGSPVTPPFWPHPISGKRGSPAIDAADALAWVLESAHMATYDLTAPASPLRLRPSDACNQSCPVPRLNVWPLVDAVWLDNAWRRPGELNVVALTDHVGAVKNARALGSVREFFAGRRVDVDDEGTWRGVLVSLVRAGFEPWRPGR